MLKNKTIEEFLEVLGSESPAPGGGSVSALCGAQGAALLSMVCDLTSSNPKYEEHHEICREIGAKAKLLKSDLMDLIDEDTRAFNMVSDAFKLPKDSEQEKMLRKEAIKAGTLEATKVPLKVMTLSVEGLSLAERLIDSFNTNCDSDFGVATLNFLSALKGAWLNVKINIPGLDDELREFFEKEGKALMARGSKLAESLFVEIESRL